MKDQILWTASITPFDERGIKPDLASLEACLRRQEEAGNGVILFGSTGEGLSLSFDERKELLTFALSLNLRIPIMVGVPSHNLKDALQWLAFSRELVAGFLMTTPIYTKPGVAGQTCWFETLLDHANNKVMIYNIPSRAGIKLHVETVKNLQHHEHFWAIKDSGGTLESAVEYKMAAPHITLFAGDDYMMPAMAMKGAAGLISVASNAWPEATRRYVTHCLLGKKIDHNLWWHAGLSLFGASNPIPIKALMKDAGLIANDAVRLPLSQRDHKKRSVLLDIHETMLIWGRDDLC